MRAKRWMIGLAVVLAGGVLLWKEPLTEGRSVAAGGAKAQRQVDKAPVTVATAQSSAFPVYLTGLGTVQPLNIVTVQSRVDGQIDKIYVHEGQIVKQGDPLLRIDPRPYQAALDQANAKREQDTANLENAKLDLQRYMTLAKENFASRQQLNTQQATVRSQTAQIAADQAAVENAQVQLDYTEIRAPIGGRIGFFTVDQGNIVRAAATTGIMTIAQIQPISVVFTAPEQDLPKIAKAMRSGAVPVLALSTDQSRTLAKGKLTVINNQVDATTGTIQLKAEFANANGGLWPGLSVATRLLVRTLENAVVVPQDAVQHGLNGLYVYVVGSDDKARRRPIETGPSTVADVVVAKGLKAGERVVVAGQYRLKEGAPVTILKQPQSSAMAQEKPQ
ncbi:MAG TPA: efflux RND transporter periplasmic adaptor subunit [Beijerinckiaceae bacterium]|nr:efflux RND transporter periplasmic adaptor subunit [Beijerinckiaceae bacterium]